MVYVSGDHVTCTGAFFTAGRTVDLSQPSKTKSTTVTTGSQGEALKKGSYTFDRFRKKIKLKTRAKGREKSLKKKRKKESVAEL